MKKALLFNPPIGLYLRGEDRAQAIVTTSAATNLRCAIDLAYIAATLRNEGVECTIRDYPAEGYTRGEWQRLHQDVAALAPDLALFSTTSATLDRDMRAATVVKAAAPAALTVCKGAHFVGCDPATLDRYGDLDVAVPREAEVTIPDLVRAVRSGQALDSVAGLLYRDVGSGRFLRTPPRPLTQDLDALPFPARDLLNNRLYVRPDTGDLQTTVQVARGCPHRCPFCLAEAVHGTVVRARSPQNVADELVECIDRYRIRNFFLRADTFVYDRAWCIALCEEIIARNLDIEWVTTGHVDALTSERLEWMRRAGCWLVSLGIESGDEAILRRVKPGASVGKVERAVALCKQYGMRVYGFFVLGFPWDTEESVRATLRLMNRLDLDWVEIHLLTPYQGTPMYDTLVHLGLLEDVGFAGRDHFQGAGCGTLYLSHAELCRLRRAGLARFYLRPHYVWRMLRRTHSVKQLLNYSRYAWRMVRTLLHSPS